MTDDSKRLHPTALFFLVTQSEAYGHRRRRRQGGPHPESANALMDRVQAKEAWARVGCPIWTTDRPNDPATPAPSSGAMAYAEIKGAPGDLHAALDSAILDLARCYEEAGADPSGGMTGARAEAWRLALGAVRAVKDLRRAYEADIEAEEVGRAAAVDGRRQG